jgi:hypothetical protein
MKLAEALILRGDMQKKVASLRERIAQYAVVQKGDKPHEDPQKLLKEVAGVIGEQETLVYQINRANLGAKLPDGRTLTAALAHRDALTARHSVIKAAIDGAKQQQPRYGLKEIKWVATVDVPKLQKQADELAKQIRELNVQIQAANWAIELK